MSELEAVKREVAIANRILAELGFATGVLACMGHASMRVPSDPSTFLVKGRGYAVDALARMRPEDMVLCDLNGYRVDGPAGARQCNEVKMHSCIYRARPDVQAIIHVHPRFTVVMSVLGKTIVPMCLEGIELVQQPLPVYPRSKIIQTEEEGVELATRLGQRQAIILFGHGAVTVGRSLEEAVLAMLGLEEQAKMNWYAYCAAGRDYSHIPDHLALEMINRPRESELPHFRDEVPSDRPQKPASAWEYYVELVSQDV